MHNTAICLRNHNLKVTPQRLAIFYMLKNTTCHPSAETIYTSLHETHPTMSLATVYKTLDALVKASLIQQLNVGEDSYRYDATTLEHPHVICTDCNNVVDLDTGLLPSYKLDVEALTGFTLSKEQLYFYGICPDCKKKH
ncbi:MAG: Fur family transcriptional regulator [Cellulosilyticaceae bacterium]